jgi:protocatechuate 3,4-dioxygenase beta subunit
MSYPSLSRRAFLRLCATAASPLVLAACAAERAEPTAPTASVPATEITPPTPTGLPTEAPAAPTTAPAPTVAPTAAPVAPAATAAPAPTTLPPTLACPDDDDATPALTEGPYFTPNSPERASLLEPGMAGTRMILTGRVLTTACVPVARALLDFWHADDAGAYDNQGYRLRGHQFTDSDGRYTLETVVPGLYPGRTRHFHVKVQAPSASILTTQLFFPGEPGNQNDGIFDAQLVMDVSDTGDSKAAAFDFVVEG